MFEKPASILQEKSYRRLYFHHIRRVGGTSLNETFFQLSSLQPQLISSAMRRSSSKIVNSGGLRFVGANKAALEKGNYFYGFSHIPSHRIKIPEATFTIALFRDPVERIVSHYNMVARFHRQNVNRYWMEKERQWLGKSIIDFCRKMPRERLLAQLYAFSQSFSATEATEKVAQCNFSFFNDDYQNGINRLAGLLALDLSMRNSHGFEYEIATDSDDLKTVRELLDPEYQYLNNIRGLKNGSGI